MKCRLKSRRRWELSKIPQVALQVKLKRRRWMLVPSLLVIVELCLISKGLLLTYHLFTNVLFPYVHHNVGRHMTATYDTAETQDDIKLLRSQLVPELRLRSMAMSSAER